jgi:ferredoxin-NADP reductase
MTPSMTKMRARPGGTHPRPPSGTHFRIEPVQVVLGSIDDGDGQNLGDVVRMNLFYGRREFDELTFRDELDQLTRRMNLNVVYVLEQASPAWHGETGFIDSDLLRRHLPKQYKRFQYFICGPLAMMEAMEKILPDMGIAPEHIHTERFDIV